MAAARTTKRSLSTRKQSTATRTPANGEGSSKITVPDCIHDALTFLFYARRELGQGRVPAAQEIIFGAIYNGQLRYTGRGNDSGGREEQC